MASSSPAPLPQTTAAPAKDLCAVDGCSKLAYGKTYCHKHREQVKQGITPQVGISPERRAKMRSTCCKAGCTEGAQHEYGNQYCKTCKEPCCWSA